MRRFSSTATRSSQRASPRDLVALGKSLGAVPRVRDAVAAAQAALLGDAAGRADPVENVRDEIARTIRDDAPVPTNEGGMIREGRDAELDEIRGLGLENDTWVIFASDNGPWIVKEGDGGSPGPFRGGKSSIWEGGVRVPGIVWAPGRVAAGRTSHEMTALQDLLPTLASLAGAPLPPKVTLDGHDLSDLFLGRTAASPRNTFAYYLSAHLQAVRQGKWKLHLPRPADPEWLAPFTPSEHLAPEDAIAVTRPMLFDIESDYAERWNLADDHPQIVTELYGLVERFRADLGDYNRMGSGVRLFEPYDVRPARPVLVT